MAMQNRLEHDTRAASERRRPAIPGASGFMTWLGLFRLELRRGFGLVTALAIAAITLFVMYDVGLVEGVVRWRDINGAAGNPLWIISTFAAVAASWAAARDVHRKTVDQIETTTFGRPARDSASVLAMYLWVVCGYVIVGLGYFAYATMHATWGGPDWNKVFLVLATLAPAIMFGWLCGAHLRHQLTPLFVLILMMVVHLAPTLIHNYQAQQSRMDGEGFRESIVWWDRLAPIEIELSHELSSLLPVFALWMVGITLVLWSVHRVLVTRSIAAVASTLVALVLARGSAAALVQHDPVPWAEGVTGSVIPVCTTRSGQSITVCLHPENEALLDETADVIADVAGPIVSLPEVPTRFQEPSTAMNEEGEFFPISVSDRTTIEQQLPFDVARQLVWTPPSDPQVAYRWTPAQVVIGAWLLDADEYADIEGEGFFPPLWVVGDLSPFRDEAAITALDQDVGASYRALHRSVAGGSACVAGGRVGFAPGR